MSLPDDIDTQEPLYPCPICGVALARVTGRDGYYCEHCNAEWSATAMAMIAYPEEDEE